MVTALFWCIQPVTSAISSEKSTEKTPLLKKVTTLFPGVRPVTSPKKDALLIKDARSLKGIWEAQYTFGKTTALQRAEIPRLWLPEQKEFETKEEYQQRVDIVKQIYRHNKLAKVKEQEKRAEEFSNQIFSLVFTTGGTIPDFVQGTVYDSKRNLLVSKATSYTPADKIEGYTRESERLNLRFKLGKYNLEEKKFPIIFVSPDGDSPSKKFNPKKREFEYYSREEPIEDEIYKWIIRFNELPTYIPLELKQARRVRQNEDSLSLAIYFKSTQATKEAGNKYILAAKFTSVSLETGKQVCYASESGKWETAKFTPETSSWNEAGWDIEPKYVDADPIDGINDPGSPSNPWIIKPKDPSYGPTYEVCTKYFYGSSYLNRRRQYNRTPPLPHHLNYILNSPRYLMHVGEALAQPFFKLGWSWSTPTYGRVLRAAEYPVASYPFSMQVLSAPGNTGNPYIVKEVLTAED